MFSGCGGFDLGLTGGFDFLGTHYERLPYDIVWSNDQSTHASEIYKRNLDKEIHVGCVWDCLDTLPDKCDLIVGGFPCQDISINNSKKRTGVAGSRSGLYRAMVEAVDRLKPKIFVAENVRGLLTLEDSLNLVLRDFGAIGYDVSYQLYHAADYGVPQRRERLFIVGVRDGFAKFVPPSPTHRQQTFRQLNFFPLPAWISAKQAIFDLEDRARDPATDHVWPMNQFPETLDRSSQSQRRLDPDKPAPTITAQAHGNTPIHYRLPRRISTREAARFQSFPDNFLFDGKSLRSTEVMIGNAVPPVLAWCLGKSLLTTLHQMRCK